MTSLKFWLLKNIYNVHPVIDRYLHSMRMLVETEIIRKHENDCVWAMFDGFTKDEQDYIETMSLAMPYNVETLTRVFNLIKDQDKMTAYLCVCQRYSIDPWHGYGMIVIGMGEKLVERERSKP